MTVYNRLFVTPLPQTLDYISKMTEHSPVHIDLNSLRVEIISTLDDVVALPQRVYAAEPSSLTPWYDTALGYSGCQQVTSPESRSSRCKARLEQTAS
jgi:hypothetical protein